MNNKEELGQIEKTQKLKIKSQEVKRDYKKFILSLVITTLVFLIILGLMIILRTAKNS